MDPGLKTQITAIAGDCDDTSETLERYSHDASLFEVLPSLVVYPKNSSEIEKLVSLVSDNKKSFPDLAITPRSAGTDMSGGAIGDSIIMDFTKHMNGLIKTDERQAEVQPGLHYRDFEVETLKHNALMPSFPASSELCALGGMVANNSGGEMSLRYGKTINYVTALKTVLPRVLGAACVVSIFKLRSPSPEPSQSPITSASAPAPAKTISRRRGSVIEVIIGTRYKIFWPA